MSRSSNLVPLLAGLGGGKGVGFRQGVVVAWDPDTAENQIQVGNTVIDNLPILNTSEASLLVPGDVVGILTSGSSWAIMGRLVIPGTPEAASSIRSITNRIQAASDPAGGERNSSSWGDLYSPALVGPEVSIRIGSSGRALAFWSAEIGQTTAWQEKNNPHVGVSVSGANSIAPSDQHALNWHWQFPVIGAPGGAVMNSWIQSSVFHLYTGLSPGDTLFTMKYRHDGITPPGNVKFEAREIVVFAL